MGMCRAFCLDVGLPRLTPPPQALRARVEGGGQKVLMYILKPKAYVTVGEEESKHAPYTLPDPTTEKSRPTSFWRTVDMPLWKK